MKYFILLCLGLCSCISNFSDSGTNNLNIDYVHKEIPTIPPKVRSSLLDENSVSDSVRNAINQELTGNDTIELTRLIDLLTAKSAIENKRKHLKDDMNSASIDSCIIILRSDYNEPSFKIAITRKLSLIGFSSDNKFFSFDSRFPVFTLKEEIAINILECMDNIYIKKSSPKILRKESGRVKSSETTEILIKYYFDHSSGYDSYFQNRDNYSLIPEYAYSVYAQYIMSVVNRIYYEYCNNIGLQTQNTLGEMMWYIK